MVDMMRILQELHAADEPVLATDAAFMSWASNGSASDRAENVDYSN